MNLLEKKIFTMFYIKEHKNLTKKERISLYEFVEQADTDQIDRLLKTGKPDYLPKVINEDDASIEYWSKLQQQAWKQAEARIKDMERSAGVGGGSKLSADTLTGVFSPNVLTGAAVGAAVAAAVATAYLVYTRFLSKAARTCKNASDKKACMKKFKMDAQKARIQKLQQGISLCSKTKEPAKCKSKLNVKIAKEKLKLGA